MPSRTPEEFDDLLYQDLAWRKAELHRLRLQIEETSGITQEMLLRAGIALLYAHWEGFVKNATSSYIEFVGRRRLRRRQLRECFSAVAARRQLRRGAHGGTHELMEMYRKLVDPDERVRLVPEDFVNTGSNLGWNSFENILSAIGLSPRQYESKAHLLDYSLLATRNSIAHGRYQDQGLEGYQELHDAVEGLLNQFRSELSNAAAQGGYRS